MPRSFSKRDGLGALAVGSVVDGLAGGWAAAVRWRAGDGLRGRAAVIAPLWNKRGH